MEQVEVLRRIFGGDSEYPERVTEPLKQAMKLSDLSETEAAVYGKTGMGKDRGVTVDAWFTGFADTEDRRLYFCVYLGESEGVQVTSQEAKAIALQILSQYGGA